MPNERKPTGTLDDHLNYVRHILLHLLIQKMFSLFVFIYVLSKERLGH